MRGDDALFIRYEGQINYPEAKYFINRVWCVRLTPPNITTMRPRTTIVVRSEMLAIVGVSFKPDEKSIYFVRLYSWKDCEEIKWLS